VRYRATALETIEQTMTSCGGTGRSTRRDGAGGAGAARGRAVRELYDRHYRDWLDRPLLALANRTSARRGASPLWRRKVVDLLKGFENMNRAGALHGRPPYDFHWIWRELDLERPGTAAEIS
jgi:hypothetical protein